MASNNDRYNPPVKHHQWSTHHSLSRDEFLDEVQSTLKLDKSVIQSALRHGGLTIGKKRIWREDIPQKIPAQTVIHLYHFLREPAEIEISKKDILYQAHDLVAYNKPAWLPTQGTRVSRIYCLEEKLRIILNCPTLMALHRLDRQTSGVVLFGKNGKVAAEFMKKFETRQIDKKYLAVVSPPPEKKSWKVSGYLVRDFRKLPRDVFKFSPKETKESKWSESDFSVVHTDGKLALVEAVPLTGRTHQLRIHLSSSGCPLVGDHIYGKPDSSSKGIRIQLHAQELSLSINNQPIRIVASVPEDFILKPVST